MALFLSGEDPRGPGRGAKGSCAKGSSVFLKEPLELAARSRARRSLSMTADAAESYQSRCAPKATVAESPAEIRSDDNTQAGTPSTKGCCAPDV